MVITTNPASGEYTGAFVLASTAVYRKTLYGTIASGTSMMLVKRASLTPRAIKWYNSSEQNDDWKQDVSKKRDKSGERNESAAGTDDCDDDDG
ncbi:unnamed protein product [Gongylonema pulchrum]|uniref:Uncharacterized protein n=1 Tax=Gongylonema pulchrum TaxID=637853 RepID=A0A183EUM4_9BILA|nr:unnamed protein product [Gongylonema pulchrum]